MWNRDKIAELVSQHPILIFAKGSKEQPMCGFSHRAIQIMQAVGAPFEVVNIFDDANIRPSLVEFSGWPTTPQLFIGGELIGGSDIALEMYESGELQQKIQALASN